MTLLPLSSVTTLSAGAARQFVWTAVTMRNGTNCPGRNPLSAGNNARTRTVPLSLATSGLTNESSVVTGGSVSTSTGLPGFKSPASAAGISALTASRFKSITSATTVVKSTAWPGLTLTRATVPDNGAVTRSKASCASASCRFLSDVFCCAYNFFCRSTSCSALSAVAAPEFNSISTSPFSTCWPSRTLTLATTPADGAASCAPAAGCSAVAGAGSTVP